MKKIVIKTLSFLMVLTVAFACLPFSFAEQEAQCLTECAGDCDYSPVIVVPGIMQSQVYVQDENDNDLLTVDGFPLVEGMDMAFLVDGQKLKEDLKKLILPLFKSIVLCNRKYFLDAFVEVANDNLKSHFFKPDGTRFNDVDVDEYWYSLEACKSKPDKSYNYAKGYSKDEDGNSLPTTKYKTEYDFIMRQVDLSAYCELAGYDHAYYYAYSSFGDTIEIARRLNDYIAMVKQQTGHDKVNLVFISLGGTIGNVYLANFCNPDDIDRVVFAAAAIDGSYLLSDMMNADLTLDNNVALYNDILPNVIALADEDYMWLSYLGNVLLRVLPNSLFSDLLTEAGDRLVTDVLGNILYNCPSMWALVPSEEYPSMSARLISDAKHSALKAKTDAYYKIQSTSAQRLQNYVANGMDIFVVAGYNLELPALVSSYQMSSDNIIHAESTSAGAVFAKAGESLPDSYVPKIDASYLSPGREVDAGAAALPDRTWFIRNQSHLRLQSSVNDTIQLCIDIAVNKDIKNARTQNGGYPQFNDYRDLRKVERFLFSISKLTEQDLAAMNITDEQRSELNAAYKDGMALCAKKVWKDSERVTVEKRLNAIVFELGIDSVAVDPKKLEKTEKLTGTMQFFSDLLTDIYGSRDFYTWIRPY